jgi:hypothetical protein
MKNEMPAQPVAIMVELACQISLKVIPMLMAQRKA